MPSKPRTKDESERYWELEEPVMVKTKNFVLRYFPERGKFWASYPDYERLAGKTRQGKTVVMPVDLLRTDEVKALFREVLGI